MNRLFYFLLILVLAASSCGGDDDTMTVSGPAPLPPVEAPRLGYLALGDSYTIGTSIPSPDRWSAQLVAAIEDSTDFEFGDLQYVAQNGWRSDNLLAGMRSTQLRESYDLVSVLIGVNDLFQNQPIETYEANLRIILERAIGLARDRRDRVFMVSIPDYAFTPFGNGSQQITRTVERFNTLAERVADDFDIAFYNVTPISQRGLQETVLVSGDGLHPSGEQYRRWVQQVLLEPVTEQLRR